MAERKDHVSEHQTMMRYVNKKYNLLRNEMGHLYSYCDARSSQIQTQTNTQTQQLLQKLDNTMQHNQRKIERRLRQNRHASQQEAQEIQGAISNLHRNCSICIALIMVLLCILFAWQCGLTNMYSSLADVVNNLNDNLLSFSNEIPTSEKLNNEINTRVNSLFNEKEKKSQEEKKDLTDSINTLANNLTENVKEINQRIEHAQSNHRKSDKFNECVRLEFDKAKEKKRAENMFFCSINWDDEEYYNQNEKAKDICRQKVFHMF